MTVSSEAYALLTPLSKNLYTVMNGILHLYKLNGCPEKIVLISPPEDWVSSHASAIQKAINTLCPRTSVERIKTPHSLTRLAGRFKAETVKLKKEGLKVYVNITPGTKVMSIAAYEGAITGKADKTFYLGIEDSKYSSTLLPFIPSPKVSYYSPKTP